MSNNAHSLIMDESAEEGRLQIPEKIGGEKRKK